MFKNKNNNDYIQKHHNLFFMDIDQKANNYKNFQYSIINSGLSRLGFSIFNLSTIWIILYITHSPLLSGIADGLMSAPLFLSFIVGAYIDKFTKKKILSYISSVIRSLSIIFIIIAVYLNNDLMIIITIYLAAFIIGFTSDILNSIRSVWLKQFLTEDQYKKGVGLSNSVYSLAEGIGYILSGLLLTLGLIGVFSAITIIFIISIIPLLMIKVQEKKLPESFEIKSSIKEGIIYIIKTNVLWQVMIIAFLGNFIFGMGGIIFVSLVQIVYKVSAVYVSLIFVSIIGGIVFGSILGPKIKGKAGKISIFSYVLLGMLLSSVYFIRNIYLIFIPSILIGIIIGIINVLLGSNIFKIIPEHLVARVQGAFSTFSVAIVSLSGFIGGALAQFIGILNTFLFLGLLIVFISPLFLFFKDLYDLKV